MLLLLLATYSLTLPATPRIGFRFDGASVAFEIARWDGVVDVGVRTETKYFVHAVLEMSDEVKTKRKDALAAVPRGSTWEVDVGGGRRFGARVDRHLLGGVGCETIIIAVATIEEAHRSAYAQLKERYFLVHSAGTGPPPDPVEPRSWQTYVPTETERSKIAQTLARELVLRLPSVSVDGDAIARRNPDAEYVMRWRATDRRLARGDGALSFDAHALRLPGDQDLRLYVRARWVLDGHVVFLLGAWFRRGAELLPEAFDVGASSMMRTWEFQTWTSWDVEALPSVLNAVGAEGRGLIILDAGYEGFEVRHHRYGPRGPERTQVAFGGGC